MFLIGEIFVDFLFIFLESFLVFNINYMIGFLFILNKIGNYKFIFVVMIYFIDLNGFWV